MSFVIYKITNQVINYVSSLCLFPQIHVVQCFVLDFHIWRHCVHITKTRTVYNLGPLDCAESSGLLNGLLYIFKSISYVQNNIYVYLDRTIYSVWMFKLWNFLQQVQTLILKLIILKKKLSSNEKLSLVLATSVLALCYQGQVLRKVMLDL